MVNDIDHGQDFENAKDVHVKLLRPRKHFPLVCRRISYVKIIFLQIISELYRVTVIHVARADYTNNNSG